MQLTCQPTRIPGRTFSKRLSSLEPLQLDADALCRIFRCFFLAAYAVHLLYLVVFLSEVMWTLLGWRFRASKGHEGHSILAR